MSPSKKLMLPYLENLTGDIFRSRVLIDLSAVNFNGQTIYVYNKQELITTITSQGIYEFISAGTTYFRSK